MSSSEQFGKLTHTQLASMLMDNSLRVPSEYRLFTMVLRWIGLDSEDRLQYLAQLMRHVRLPLLAGEELVEKVRMLMIVDYGRVDIPGTVKIRSTHPKFNITVLKTYRNGRVGT